jgi:hypothetical protein
MPELGFVEFVRVSEDFEVLYGAGLEDAHFLSFGVQTNLQVSACLHSSFL